MRVSTVIFSYAWREEKNQKEETGYPVGVRENQAWY